MLGRIVQRDRTIKMHPKMRDLAEQFLGLAQRQGSVAPTMSLRDISGLQL